MLLTGDFSEYMRVTLGALPRFEHSLKMGETFAPKSPEAQDM